MSNSNKLYQELVTLSEDYFGPATDRFLTAQIKNHLHKTPAQLTHEDIPKLIDWLALSLSVISRDKKQINRYIALVRKLGTRS
jgi:hypothetical protein